DQWGVELGKILGKVVEADLSAESVDPAKHDSSTTALSERARAALNRGSADATASCRCRLRSPACAAGCSIQV
ncbi:hypothetical protein NO135_25545, partial [Clostridioides difficile]|nr:hypothetical protein [Clostridioides difficile]